MKYVIFDKWAVERVNWSALIAIGDALKNDGVSEVEYFTPSFFQPGYDMPITEEEDISGIFTWHWNYFNIQSYYKKKRIDVYTVDFGFLERDKGYQFVLKNNTFVVNKPEDRFQALNLNIKSSYKEDGHILICKQNHHLDWYEMVLNVIKDKTKKDIIVREFDEKKSLEKDLKGASAIVTYNSTCLYRALLYRIPIFCSKDCPAANSKSAIESKIINLNFDFIDKIGRVEDPVQFLSNVAYNQYTLDELRGGIWIKEVM